MTILVTFDQREGAKTNTAHVDGSVYVLECGTRLVCSFLGIGVAMNGAIRRESKPSMGTLICPGYIMSQSLGLTNNRPGWSTWRIVQKHWSQSRHPGRGQSATIGNKERLGRCLNLGVDIVTRMSAEIVVCGI